MGPKASFGEAQGNNAPWPGGKPSDGRLQRVSWPGAQAAASWFCLWAEAPAPTAAAVGARVSSPPLLSETWESPLAPLGGLGFWQTPAASRQRFPWWGGRHLFPTSCCADVALERRRRVAWRWWAVQKPPGARKNLGSLLVRGTLSLPLVARGVLHPCLCPGKPRRPGHFCIWPLWGLLYLYFEWKD